MNIDKMTLDECRDYIAERTGWERKVWDNCDLLCIKYRYRPVGTDNYWLAEHPIAPTIDAIAASLPSNYRWDRITSFPGGGLWNSIIREIDFDTGAVIRRIACDAATEILARARVACFAWRVIEQESPK